MDYIHINDRYLPWTDYIKDGSKTVETRSRPVLDRFIGHRVGIIRTGVGPAAIVAFATITGRITYAGRDDLKNDHRTRIPFWSCPYSDNRYGYILEDVVSVSPVVIGAEGFNGNRTYRTLNISEDDLIPNSKRDDSESDRFNFVCSCLYDEEHVPMTVEDAAYTIRVWTEEEGAELPEGFTPEYFATTWNALIAMEF